MSAPFAVEYAASPSVLFRFALRDLPEPLSAFVFVDYGSGKGRVLIRAAEHPFKSILGVEFAPELHRMATENLARAGLSERARSILADAAEFRIPEDPCILYFYNPFGAPVMRAVLDGIQASYQARPRPIFLVYLNPDLLELFRAQPWLTEVRKSFGTRLRLAAVGGHDLRIFRVGPSDGGRG